MDLDDVALRFALALIEIDQREGKYRPPARLAFAAYDLAEAMQAQSKARLTGVDKTLPAINYEAWTPFKD